MDKPHALRLAEWLEESTNSMDKLSAEELRRLHSLNQEWVSLTDEERSDVIGDIFGNIFAAPQKSLSLARAIEAKLKERNGG